MRGDACSSRKNASGRRQLRLSHAADGSILVAGQVLASLLIDFLSAPEISQNPCSARGYVHEPRGSQPGAVQPDVACGSLAL